mmetsp:Transcript_22919/g.57473  ORF Transcript_22919/g.57473 Transcript_22919/m.57473 type:complete len:376 (-) Transcript_22919:194-1321(-)
MPWTAATVPAASTHAYRLHSSSTAPGSNPTPLGRAQQQLVLRVRILDRAIFVMGKAVPLALGLALLVLPFAAATRTLSFYDSYDFGYLDYGGDEADNTGYGGYSGGYDYPYDDEDYEEPCVEEGEEGGNTEGSGVCVGCAPITAGAHPYFIALATQYNPFGVHCGGTIIAPDIVITAAHCMKIRLRVQVGRISLLEGEYQEYAVTHAVIHPEYDSETLHNDVALLKLSKAVEGVEPARLIGATSLEALEGRLADVDMSVMGFGRTTENGRTSKKLLVGTVQHVPKTDCNGPDSYDGRITGSMLCAKGDGVDSCEGDSGGPLIRQTPVGNNFLVGVVSYGIGCGNEQYPGVYVDVNAVRPWINKEIRRQDTWQAVR